VLAPRPEGIYAPKATFGARRKDRTERRFFFLTEESRYRRLGRDPQIRRIAPELASLAGLECNPQGASDAKEFFAELSRDHDEGYRRILLEDAPIGIGTEHVELPRLFGLDVPQNVSYNTTG
jgi:hypothetical protein